LRNTGDPLRNAGGFASVHHIGDNPVALGPVFSAQATDEARYPEEKRQRR